MVGVMRIGVLVVAIGVAGCGAPPEQAVGDATSTANESGTAAPMTGADASPGDDDGMSSVADVTTMTTIDPDDDGTTSAIDSDPTAADTSTSTAVDASTSDAESSSTGPAANPFAGDYAGTFQGSCPDAVGGSVQLNVADDGTLTGSSMNGNGVATIAGTVDAAGTIVATSTIPDFAVCTFTGQIAGGLATGTWSCNASCSGTWMASAI